MRYSLFVFIICSTLSLSLFGQDKLYEFEHIVDVRLTFSQSGWHEHLDSLKEQGHDKRMICDLTVDGVSFPQTGVRYKGNSSYFNVRNEGGRKLPFNLKVNYVNKKARLTGGFETLKLSNVFRDPSFMREVLSYDIARKYMPASRANYARVYVNDNYLGLYNLTESVDNDFLKKFYGSKEGVLMKCDPHWNENPLASCKKGDKASLQYLGNDSLCYYSLYELKSKDGWGELIALTKEINQRPENLHEIMDVNEVLWMLAFDNVLVNLDSYLGRLCHNYYLFKDKHDIWHPIIWDMNLCFGGFRYTGIGGPLSNEAMQEMSVFTHFKEKNEKRPLVVQLLSNSHNRKVYLAHVRTIVEENFSNGWYKERINTIKLLVEEEIKRDTNKLYPQEDFLKNIDQTVRVGNSSIIGLTELMDKRAEAILAHPLMQKKAPVITEVKHTVTGDSVFVTAQIADADAGWLYFRTENHGAWQRTALTASETSTWSAEAEIGERFDYYVIAENKYIAQLSPRRAGVEYYEVVVK